MGWDRASSYSFFMASYVLLNPQRPINYPSVLFPTQVTLCFQSQDPGSCEVLWSFPSLLLMSTLILTDIPSQGVLLITPTLASRRLKGSPVSHLLFPFVLWQEDASVLWMAQSDPLSHVFTCVSEAPSQQNLEEPAFSLPS